MLAPTGVQHLAVGFDARWVVDVGTIVCVYLANDYGLSSSRPRRKFACYSEVHLSFVALNDSNIVAKRYARQPRGFIINTSQGQLLFTD